MSDVKDNHETEKCFATDQGHVGNGLSFSSGDALAISSLQLDPAWLDTKKNYSLKKITRFVQIH